MSKENSNSNYSRWGKAQSAEKKYWKTHKLSDDKLTEFWAKVLKKGFNLDFDFFNDKDVLEVGSGPSGMIFSITGTKSRIAIEPMDISDITKDWKKKIIRVGKGENLPINNNTVDILICFNVLDHTQNPESVLAECNRVLCKNGKLLFNMHILRNQYKIFQSLLNKIDSPHPYHLTANETKSMISKYFAINKERIINGLGFEKKYKHHGSIKFFFGNYTMKNMFLILDKK